MAPRKICIVTGTRAEYGLLRWLMEEIVRDDALVLQTIVTGAHLSAGFGETWREIEADGFSIDERVDMEVGDDSPRGMARSLGLGVMRLAEALDMLAPDIVVLLGDRYEIMAAAQAAMLLRLPIAHIHGGELTEGLIDEAIRHSVTKMSHLHFTATETYRQRVIQLGEQPERVFNTGSPGIDYIARASLPDRDTLARRIGFALDRPYLLVTYHPVTLEPGSAAAAQALCAALDEFPDYGAIITSVNADLGRDAVAGVLSDYAGRSGARVMLTASLGRTNYLGALKHAAACVGNSSSGLLEAPAIGIPSVNLGNRQRGRVRAAGVIDCGETRAEIAAAIRAALEPEFRDLAREAPYPFGAPGASHRIVETLKQAALDDIVIKRFHDLVQ